jgi:sensor c-di-GMP phosphodiesterase-like protein
MSVLCQKRTSLYWISTSFSTKSNFFDPNQRTQDRISVSIVELESQATMTEELRVIIFIALGLSGVVGLWLSALWVAGGFVLP